MLSVTALGGDGVVSVARHLVCFCVQSASRVLSPNQFEDAVELRKHFSGSVRIVAVCRFVQGIRDARDLLDRALDACMFAGVQVA